MHPQKLPVRSRCEGLRVVGTWQGCAARAGSHPAPSLANSSEWALGKAELGVWKPKADPADPLCPLVSRVGLCPQCCCSSCRCWHVPSVPDRALPLMDADVSPSPFVFIWCQPAAAGPRQGWAQRPGATAWPGSRMGDWHGQHNQKWMLMPVLISRIPGCFAGRDC